MNTKPRAKKQENGILNILINIVIPVFILHKLSAPMGSLAALILALAFPILYGIYDIVQFRKFNFMSLLGLINISLTGSLALLQLSGNWFSVKEAAFPALIGIFVFASSFSKKPFIQTLLLNPQLLHLDLIETKIKQAQKETEFQKHIRLSTQFLSFSFFFSACVNFFLAQRIFIPIDITLESEAKTLILNQQIAQMTSYAAGVLILPSMIFLSLILWHLLLGIRKMTGLSTNEIMKS